MRSWNCCGLTLNEHRGALIFSDTRSSCFGQGVTALRLSLWVCVYDALTVWRRSHTGANPNIRVLDRR